MYLYRFNRKRCVLIILISTQLILIGYFFLYRTQARESLNKISFLSSVHKPENLEKTSIKLKNHIQLKSVSSRGYFLDFNSSMCFTEGTDIKTMIVVKGINWKCNCLPRWHGPDCGYSEVLFRALLASKKTLKLKGPSLFQRRLIYIFKLDKLTETLADMRINALGDIVDVFVLYGNDSNSFENQLKTKVFKNWQHKIIYITSHSQKNIWKVMEFQISNMQSRDFIIFNPSNEIPDRASLIFLKFYENIPEPIHFRLKWSVFGFFWTHPKKTVISGGACTVAYLRNYLNNNLEALTSNTTISGLNQKGITLGDLNHTGGWFCEYCATPEDIIEFLTSNSSKNFINWDTVGTNKITHKYIENLIENGLYVDGKTELERGHRYSEKDFAPAYVIENEFKFDFLLINFYSQNDYYM